MQKKRKRWDVWLVECLLRPFRLLPLGFHYACGRGLAWFLEKVMHYRRDVVFINLSRSFPDKKYHEIRAIAKDFYKHLAWDVGAGLRLDISFAVIRLDIGFKTYNPATSEWTGPGKWFKKNNFEISFGIGYPF